MIHTEVVMAFRASKGMDLLYPRDKVLHVYLCPSFSIMRHDKPYQFPLKRSVILDQSILRLSFYDSLSGSESKRNVQRATSSIWGCQVLAPPSQILIVLQVIQCTVDLVGGR